MAKRKKRNADRVQEIKFDAASRRDFITGFRKRKEQRRKKAFAEDLERERQDKIEARRDHREDVKRKWREVQWAERRVAKALGGGPRDPALRMAQRAEPRALADGEGSVTVAFEREDDDPFGDCEVTTADVEGANLWPIVPVPLDGMVSTSGTEISTVASALAPLDNDRWQKRSANLAKEEERRRSAASRRLVKQMIQKKREGHKKSKKAKGSKERGKKTKTGARARRARMKRK